MNGNQHKYNESTIRRIAPASSGVYVIDSPTKWIYIGESSNIRERLLDHYRGYTSQSECIQSYSPETFDFERVTGRLKRIQRQNELIRAWGPECNKT